jgi:hypothetical protein
VVVAVTSRIRFKESAVRMMLNVYIGMDMIGIGYLEFILSGRGPPDNLTDPYVPWRYLSK